MSTGGNALLNAVSDKLITSQLLDFDIIVDAAGGGDYTELNVAITAGGSSKAYFVKAGTYTESADVDLSGLSNLKIVFAPGVLLNFAAGKRMKAMASVYNGMVTGGISGTSVTVTGKDLSDMATNFAQYKLFYKNRAYGITAANDATDVITLAESIISPDAGSTNYVSWAKGAASNVVLEGQLEISSDTNCSFFGLYNCDFGHLDVTYTGTAGLNFLYIANCNLGKWRVVNHAWGATSQHTINCNYLAGIVQFEVKNVSANHANNVACVQLTYCEAFDVSVNVSNATNAGAGNLYGVAGATVKNGVVRGVSTNTDDDENGLSGNVNIVGLVCPV